MAKKVKEAQDESIDIDTFKAWLSGVEDMQGDDWTPTAEQWKKIRSKINLLTVTEYDDPKQFPNQTAYRAPGQIGGPISQQPWINPAPVQGPVAYPQGSSLEPSRPQLAERPNFGPQGALPGFQAPGAGNGSTNSLIPSDQGDSPYESSFG